MATQIDFRLPENQDGNVQISLAPPTSISGWSIQLDLMYRFNSPQPLVSKYLASGYSQGQSGITLVDGTKGVFSASFHPPEVSGVSLVTNALTWEARRTDSGNVLPVAGGYRLLPPL